MAYGLETFVCHTTTTKHQGLVTITYADPSVSNTLNDEEYVTMTSIPHTDDFFFFPLFFPNLPVLFVNLVIHHYRF